MKLLKINAVHNRTKKVGHIGLMRLVVLCTVHLFYHN